MTNHQVKWKNLIKWWIIDYKENLALRLASWFEVDLKEFQNMTDPFVKSMYYVIDLANRLVQMGFRVIYANFSYIEYRNRLYGVWPDLLIGKNGKIGLIEVKGEMNLKEAIQKILGRELKTNFFEKANFIELAIDLGASLFLAYYDKNDKDYRIIPVINVKNCLLTEERVKKLRESRKTERQKAINELRQKVVPLTLSELNGIFMK